MSRQDRWNMLNPEYHKYLRDDVLVKVLLYEYASAKQKNLAFKELWREEGFQSLD